MSNAYRELLAQAIEKNGGYSRGYHERFALAFTVGLYYANIDREHIYKKAVQEFGPLAPLTYGIEWDENDEWQSAQESMACGLNDDDGNRTYSPDTAARYGLPYHSAPGLKYWRRRKAGDVCGYAAKLPGWWIVNPYANETYGVEFGLYGRGGKHLCVESFEGKSLQLSSDDLADAIRNDEDGSYPNKWCQRLLAMLTEWEQCFTSRNASAELEYLCAERMAQRVNERADAWRAALAKARTAKAARIKESEARDYWASRDVLTVGA